MPTYSARSRSRAVVEDGRIWNHLDVEIIASPDRGGRVIGAYIRNYPEIYETFRAFRKNGQDYALYSPDYTCTRVMELPGCRDIGGETPDGRGFCPIGYFIPDATKVGDYAGRIAFVCGCCWARPGTIEFLDLSRVERGTIRRTDLPVDVATDPNGLADCFEFHPVSGGLGFTVRRRHKFTLRAHDDHIDLKPD